MLHSRCHKQQIYLLQQCRTLSSTKQMSQKHQIYQLAMSYVIYYTADVTNTRFIYQQCPTQSIAKQMSRTLYMFIYWQSQTLDVSSTSRVVRNLSYKTDVTKTRFIQQCSTSSTTKCHKYQIHLLGSLYHLTDLLTVSKNGHSREKST